MKTDVLIVPNDTLVLGLGHGPRGRYMRSFDGRLPPDLFLQMLHAAYASCGLQTPRTMRITAQLVAMGVGGRLEPLYPVPDDLVVEPGAKDAVWAQPAYFEMVSEDVVQHDMGNLHLLVASSRNPDTHPFDAFLTRKGVRVWAERKPQRLTEGEHYLPLSRLFEIELRGSGEQTAAHLFVKPGVGFLVSFETPDDSPTLPLPMTVRASLENRSVQIEEAQYPLPTIETKSRKRWRLCLLSHLHVENGGWPPWVDGATLTTRAPLPEGGKVVAVARRRGENVVGAPFNTTPGPAQTIIPIGTTLFIEFEEPVQVEQSAEILAGGS